MGRFHAKVNLNLSAPISGLQVSIQRVANLVSLGLRAVDGMQAPEGGIPGVFLSFSPAENIKWDELKTKDEFSHWVLVNGFRDAVECINTCLESYFQIVCTWRLKDMRNENGQITGDDWNELMVSAPKRFNGLGLPDKIDKLRKELAVDISDTIVDEIYTVNKVRNCLVHRNGIVSERDNNCPEGLKVRWRIIRIGYNEEGKEVLISGPTKFEKGTEIFIGFDSTDKLFPNSTKINFSPIEFSDLVWTVFAFGQYIAKIIDEYGRKNGHIVEEKQNKT